MADVTCQKLSSVATRFRPGLEHQQRFHGVVRLCYVYVRSQTTGLLIGACALHFLFKSPFQMSSTVAAIGSNQLWSFTPALDLQEHCVQVTHNASAGAQSAAAAVATAAPAKAGSVSSKLANLLLKASASAAPAATSAAVPAAGSTGSLSLLLVEPGDVLSALKTCIRAHTHVRDGKQSPIQVRSEVHQGHSERA
jgi:hypothetical protein